MIRCALITLVLVYLCSTSFPATAAEATRPLWRPVADDVFLQEVGYKVPSDAPIVSVAIHGDQVYAMDEDGNPLAVREDAKNGYVVQPVQDSTADCPQVSCSHLGELIVAREKALFRVEGDELVALGEAPAPLQHIASYSETIYCMTDDGLMLFDGASFVTERVVEWGKLPSDNVRDMLALGSRLFFATDKGLGVLRGTAMTALTGADGLCYEDTTCLAQGFGSDLWIGTTRGAIRYTNGEFHYFGAERWLPGDHVHDIACRDHSVFIATDKGIGIIEYEPFTLLKKAAYYERHLEEWGQKRIGFTHKLEWNPSKGGWVREVSDNDLGWSTHYLAAQCFKYAVTGEETALKEARSFFQSLKWSEEISSIDGFPARSIWAVGETGNKAAGGSGGYAAEWHPTEDGLWEWKGDTSSDETDAQYYAAAIFYELVANDAEKELVRDHLRRISAHIVDEGWILRDFDGKPTVWARWDPEYFASPQGNYAKGLNGLEILSYMRTAAAITGDAKFEDAYRQLLGFGYHEYVIGQKLTFPAMAINHSDDRLAFYVYYILLQYETDPQLRSLYMRSLERSWEIERIEHIPWFNFIYGALTGNDCETEQAVRHLREWPLDMVTHTYRNAHRADLATRPGYVTYAGGTRAISPRERGGHRWSSDSLRHDGGDGGRNVEDPAGWLDAYWMGRYYGFIEAPTAAEPDLLTIAERGLQLGAIPYDGPPRPPLNSAQ